MRPKTIPVDVVGKKKESGAQARLLACCGYGLVLGQL